MLFDLRGRGRRNTVKIIYIALAFLMGGGLVLFGIGGATSGGLVDAITGNGGGGSTNNTSRLNKQEAQAQRQIRADPHNETAWINLIRARYSKALAIGVTDPNSTAFSAKGKAELRRAADAWRQYQALNPKPSDAQTQVASLMQNAFIALGDASGATGAAEIVALGRPSKGTYANLATLAYQAGQTRKGDLAAKKALSMTPKDLRAGLKAQLDSAKAQASGAATSGTPAPTAAAG
jgi:hypothetical protein